MAWLANLKGKEVVISGDFRADFGLKKADMRDLAYEAGASSVFEDVRSTTDVFVKGRSARYKHGEFGDKEAELARRVPHAVVIDGYGFMQLCDGNPARCWAPNEPPCDNDPDSFPAALGVAFTPLETSVQTAAAKVFERDPDAVDRSLGAHRETLNCLARHVVEAGYRPLRAEDPNCAFDLAWEIIDIVTLDTSVVVAEVKSIHDQNERAQLRLGLGQVLDYGQVLELAGHKVIGRVLAVERAPEDERWVDLCRDAGVRLVWPTTMVSLFK